MNAWHVEAREWGKAEGRLRAAMLAVVNRSAWVLTDERRLKCEAFATHQTRLFLE